MDVHKQPKSINANIAEKALNMGLIQPHDLSGNLLETQKVKSLLWANL